MYKNKEYILYRLKNRLHFIETEKPTLYEAIREEGELYCTFFESKWVKKYEEEGLMVKVADIDEEIRHLKNRIKYYEGLK